MAFLLWKWKLLLIFIALDIGIRIYTLNLLIPFFYMKKEDFIYQWDVTGCLSSNILIV